MRDRMIKKPEGYKSCSIVYDPMPILVINLDYTLFQKTMVIGKDYEEFDLDEDEFYIYLERL